MKKIFLPFILTGSFLILLTINSAFKKPISDLLNHEKPVEKEINVSIATDGNYSSSAYENAMASVHITVTKWRGNKETLVWEKTFDNMQLQKYPGMNNPLTQHISVPAVFDKKEKLVVTDTVTYNTKGSILQISDGTIVSEGVKKSSLLINI